MNNPKNAQHIIPMTFLAFVDFDNWKAPIMTSSITRKNAKLIKIKNIALPILCPLVAICFVNTSTLIIIYILTSWYDFYKAGWWNQRSLGHHSWSWKGTVSAPFSRKVVISREIEKSRQIDGNPDGLLKFLIPPSVNSSQVFSLGFVMGGRSFLLIGKRKEQPFSDWK